MTQSLRWSYQLLHDRRNLQLLLFSALVGSMTGALCAGISGWVIPSEVLFSCSRPFLLSALRLCLFPILMAAALLLHSRFLFCLLFFAKGLAVSCVLCVAAASGFVPLSRILPILLFETLLPLPAYFQLGGLWCGQACAGRRSFCRIFPALLSVLLGLLLERVLL